jgi:hypothetical protein
LKKSRSLDRTRSTFDFYFRQECALQLKDHAMPIAAL